MPFQVFIESSAASAILGDPGLTKDLITRCVVQGAAVMCGVYTAGGITGGFLNPAVTFAWTVLGRLKWINYIAYSAAQYLGAFAASAVTFTVYYGTLPNRMNTKRGM